MATRAYIILGSWPPLFQIGGYKGLGEYVDMPDKLHWPSYCDKCLESLELLHYVQFFGICNHNIWSFCEFVYTYCAQRGSKKL